MSGITSVLVTREGLPQASPEILRRLGQVSPRLGLRFYPALQQWGVTIQWREQDPRREMAQRGEIGGTETYDLVCFLPTDCAVDEAVAYMVPRMAEHPQQDVRGMMRELLRQNDAQSDANVAPVFEEIMNQVEVLVENRRRPTVFMNDTEARTTRNSNDVQRILSGRDDRA